MLLALTLLALCSVKASAQSPPCSRKPSPAATRPSAFFRLRASPANTRGGNVESRRSTAASAALSGYSGTWRIGLLRQLSRGQRSGMTALHHAETPVRTRFSKFGNLIHEGRRRKPDGIAIMGPAAQTKRGAIRPPRADGSAPSPAASPAPPRRSDAPP